MRGPPCQTCGGPFLAGKGRRFCSTDCALDALEARTTWRRPPEVTSSPAPTRPTTGRRIRVEAAPSRQP